ncbi:MAG: hydantoinase B/oxoprolinase family protein, partial [Proteobacteria bacterium]|nr:hydantoinase B/oxoprolinase family protein [Pseudomonadota bacterium]
MISGGGRWHIWIDRGGTFTDIVARAPDGHIHSHKLLSQNPGHYDDAALEGIRVMLGRARGRPFAKDEPIPPDAIAAVKMGTTVATNALLERRGEPTVLVITKGFADALRIGYQNRPRLFDRHIVLPEMLYTRIVEVDERVMADGTVLRKPDRQAVLPALRAAAREARAAAIVFMHGYRYPAHEREVAELAREAGFEQISISHLVSPLMKLVARGDTTVADAYLTPILRRYVDRVADALTGTRLMFMQSSGALTDASLFQGKDAILSGPAGGVVGMARTAEAAGFEKAIGFDMGGTSTDVAHFDGAFERAFETSVAGIRVRAPMLSIHTVAAGGGSILRFDGARFRVGPDSAGADPGPACYRRGGPLAVTDANVFLGRIQPAHFPKVFGPAADEALDGAAVAAGFAAITGAVNHAAPNKRSAEQVAWGFLVIAVENMANAIKQISIQRGRDVTEYALNCFGGAGGQHACLVADALGMKQILIHPLAGVLSAYGMGLADIGALRERAVERPLNDEALRTVAAQAGQLATEAQAEVLGQGIAPHNLSTVRRLHVRYAGTDSALILPWADDAATLAQAFEAEHHERFGFKVAGRGLIVEAVSAEAIGHTATEAERDQPRPADARAPVPLQPVRFWSGEQWHDDAHVFDRARLHPGDIIEGPALIIETNATTVVEPDWAAKVSAKGHLLLSRSRPRRSRVAVGTTVDPVLLEVFNNLFMSVAEQMGAVLMNTAHSVNIKERLDFSCAVFDPRGGLVANAPHMPVHLGSMGATVATIVRVHGASMQPGDVYAANAPYDGGTHLPDITVVTPVFGAPGGPDASNVLFFIASRGHHADIGGITPGSMPPGSRTVEEEGVVFDNILIVESGQLREAEIRAVLSSSRWPARNPEQNLADLGAQIAANETGAAELRRMITHFGLAAVHAYMGHVQANAEECMRRVIATLDDGAFKAVMDDGAEICVKITVDRAQRSCTVDFAGSSSQRTNNFNAPSAITRAAVLYVFRTLIEDDIPLNAGCLAPIEIRIPEGSMLTPTHPAAVVAGNVETSQAVVDALYGALGVLAEAQGTMNNFTFGNERHQYYETICGGSGAGPNFDGTDAVHTHMTNSRLTDPEVLEWRFPVLLDAFRIRRGSGGRGRHHG